MASVNHAAARDRMANGNRDNLNRDDRNRDNWNRGNLMNVPDALPPWRPLLRSARAREGRSPQARWLQLATLAADGTPRVRTLVFRGWAGSTALDLLTDGRSAKPAELVHQPAVEVCWLLPRARSQFRLRGSLQTLAPEQEQRERERHWQMLSPGGRALWGWPPPGEPFDPEAAFPEQLPDGSPLPDQFLLLRIALAQVELLELTGHPHRRRRWRRESGWAEECLNP
jgi:pyridoxamine 5'-phosphate oxidase